MDQLEYQGRVFFNNWNGFYVTQKTGIIKYSRYNTYLGNHRQDISIVGTTLSSKQEHARACINNCQDFYIMVDQCLIHVTSDDIFICMLMVCSTKHLFL